MSSPLKGTLRLIGLLLTLLSLLTLATAAYSLYREYALLSSGLKLGLEQAASPQGLSVRITGSLPNEGLYPLGASLSVILTMEGHRLGEGSSGELEIAPGSEAQLDLGVTVNPFAIGNATFLRRLALNGSQFELILHLGMSLRPLAFASASVRTAGFFPPPMGNLTIGKPRLDVQGEQVTARVPVSFVNYSPLGYTALLYGILSKDGRALASSEPVTAAASPGHMSALELVFTLTSRGAPPPPYLLELHVKLGAGEFALYEEVGS